MDREGRERGRDEIKAMDSCRWLNGWPNGFLEVGTGSRSLITSTIIDTVRTTLIIFNIRWLSVVVQMLFKLVYFYSLYYYILVKYIYLLCDSNNIVVEKWQRLITSSSSSLLLLLPYAIQQHESFPTSFLAFFLALTDPNMDIDMDMDIHMNWTSTMTHVQRSKCNSKPI